MSSDPPDLPGLNYVRLLGRGGYADVFLYEQTNPRMRVAVKVLFAESLSSRALEQFAAEANTMAELADHPNIVQVFRSDVTEDGRPYLVMKYYPQRNLAVRARSERLSVPEVLQIGVRVACAVETAHRANILHRDIKPANILTSQYGEPGLTDFGIATTGADSQADAEGLSIPWSPPEVVFGSAPASRASDVYSLGATLWHLLVGRSPFEDPDGDNTSIAVMRRIREMPPPRTDRGDVPPSLERLLAQVMAKSPLDRPQTALQFARSLQAIESEQRWAPTPLVLLEEVGGEDEDEDGDLGGDDGAGGTANETRARAPRPDSPRPDWTGGPHTDDDMETRRRVVTVTPTSPPPAHQQVPVSRHPRQREGMPELVDDLGTVRRPVALSAEPEVAPPVEVTEAPVPTSRRVLMAVGSAAVAVMIVAGVLVLASHGGEGKASTTTVTMSPQSTIAVLASGASITSTTWVPSGSDVQFTWTVSGFQAGDQVWWVEDGAKHDATPLGSGHFQATVSGPPGACIQIYAADASGNGEIGPTQLCSS